MFKIREVAIKFIIEEEDGEGVLDRRVVTQDEHYYERRFNATLRELADEIVAKLEAAAGKK